MENWKSITGFEGLYKISTKGRVKSLSRKVYNQNGPYQIRERILKTTLNDGYVYCKLYKEAVQHTIRVHRLVAKAFMPNPENKPRVNHLNSVRNDNRIENLEWATISEDLKHAYKYGNKVSNFVNKGKFGDDHPMSVARYQYRLNGEFVARYGSSGEAERMTGISYKSIMEACSGRNKTAGGYIWQYEDDSGADHPSVDEPEIDLSDGDLNRGM